MRSGNGKSERNVSITLASFERFNNEVRTIEVREENSVFSRVGKIP